MAEDQFQPAWWLPGAHLQTAWGRLAGSHHLVKFGREVLETPDGDDLVLDHLDLDAASNDAAPHREGCWRMPTILSFNDINFIVGDPANDTNTITNFSAQTFGQVTQAYRDTSTTNDPGGRLVQLVLRINF
ncbi:MAG: hypothetical protein ACREUU_08360 [Gammaproteobacteria bacterium]